MSIIKKTGAGLFCLITVTISAEAQFWKKKEKETVVIDNSPGITANAKDLSRVTNDPAPEYYPKISPDGKRILFYVRDDFKKANERFGIVSIILGQPGRIPILGNYTIDASWMPDSKGFVYTYLRPAKSVICKGNIEGSYGIAYITQSSMGDGDANPNISPDGKKILFQTKIGNSFQICLMDISGLNFTVLTEGYYTSWHPSGTAFLFTKKVGNTEQVFSYDLKSGQNLQITSGNYSNFNASYSWDEKLIVFCSDRDAKRAHVFVMKNTGNDVVQLTSGNTTEWYPVFAPDNTTIYFCSNAGAPPDKQTIILHSDIWKINFKF